VGQWSGARSWLRVGSNRQTVGYAGRIAGGWQHGVGVDGLKGLNAGRWGWRVSRSEAVRLRRGYASDCKSSYGSDGRARVT
jgi:hypothetical protein